MRVRGEIIWPCDLRAIFRMLRERLEAARNMASSAAFSVLVCGPSCLVGLFDLPA